MSTEVIFFIGSIVVLLVALFFSSRLVSGSSKVLVVAVKGLVSDYFVAHSDHDIEKKQLRFSQLAVSTDRVLGKILDYYNCRSNSVKQQLRLAMQKNVITYDQFTILKRFHHMRNEVVHEGLIIHGDNEAIVYSAIMVVKTIIGA